MGWDLRNVGTASKQIRLIKRSQAVVTIQGTVGTPILESRSEIGFCLAGNPNIIVDADGNILTDGDNINLVL